MKIEKKIENEKLIINIEGRLDTTTAPELEKELCDLNGIKKIVFDFEKLEYISSFGLRIILKCKKNIDNTKIINCSTEVYDIFNITGFVEMMEIEKSLRKISVEGCPKIGEGFYGDIYRLDPETIVKVYKFTNSLDTIEEERALAKKAFVIGIPTAISYDLVKVGDLYGAVFELLDAKMLVDLIKNENDVDVYAKKCADVLKDMHSKKVENKELPSRKEELINLLNECKDSLEEDVYQKLLVLLKTIKESNHILHCDFHVKNIMVRNDELLIIDMATLSTGHPIFEFASMFATYEGFSCIDKKNTDSFLGLPLSITTKLFDKIFDDYYCDKTEKEKEDIKNKLSVICYIQILRLRTKFGNSENNTEKEEIDFCKNYLKQAAEKLKTLDY